MNKFIVFNTLAQAEDYARRKQKPFKHGDVSDPEYPELLAIFFVVDKNLDRSLITFIFVLFLLLFFFFI